MAESDISQEIRRYKRVGAITLLIFAIELLGSRLAGSVALLSDAFHVLNDASAVLIAMGVIWLINATNGKDEKAIRCIGAKINAILLAFTAIAVFGVAINELGDRYIETNVMLFFAILTGLGNVWQHKTLNMGCDHHNLTHSGLNLHIMSDILQSGGVVVGAIIIKTTQWYVVDCLISFCIGIYIAVQAKKLFVASK